MTRIRHTPDRRCAYIEAFTNAIARKLGGTRRPLADVEDIVQTEALALLAHLDEIMERYPNATTFAAVRATHAGIQWDRSQSAQRGSGSRYMINPDGTTSSFRPVLSLDAEGHDDDGTESPYQTIAASDRVDDGVVDGMETAELLERCLLGLSDTDRQLLLLVEGYGVTVSDLATAHGVARETMSRRISKLREHASLNAAEILTSREVMTT